MTSSSARWQIRDASTLLRRHWAGEDEWVIFNAASGDLHLLNSAAVGVLDRMAEGPASLDELCAAIDTPNPGALAAVLESLDRLGLIGPLLS